MAKVRESILNKKTNQQIAIEVILGKWGNGNDRRTKLTKAGYSFESVQSIVNALCDGDLSTLCNEEVKITGNDVLDIEIDLSKYCGLNITFINGGD